MSMKEITKANKCVILPFKKIRSNTKNNSSIAILIAIDIDHEKDDIPEELVTQSIEKKLNATVLHVEYIDSNIETETSTDTPCILANYTNRAGPVYRSPRREHNWFFIQRCLEVFWKHALSSSNLEHVLVEP